MSFQKFTFSKRRFGFAWRSPAALALLLMLTSAAAAQNGMPPTPVGVGEVTLERVQDQQMVTGDLRAVRRSRVASEEPGIVAEIPVLEGQLVAKGDVLAVLDRKRLELELAQIDADMEVARGVIAERQADFEMAKNDVEAIRTIFEQRAANPKELRDAESKLRWAQARVTQSERAVEAIAAQRDLLQKRLEDMTIVAPFEGIVVAKHVELGEWIAAGAPVVDLISTGAVEAWLSVPQSLYAGASDKSLGVAVTIDATGETFTASEKRIIPQVEARARTFTLVAMLANEDHSLAPGMSVVGWVPKGSAADRLTVPSDAVLQNESGHFVFVVRESAEGPPVALPVRVRVLFPQGWRRVVESDQLKAGDKVVVEGNERLMPMSPLQPVDTPVVSQRKSAQGAIE